MMLTIVKVCRLSELAMGDGSLDGDGSSVVEMEQPLLPAHV